MQPTEMSDFLDRVAALLSLAPIDKAQAARPADASLLDPPMASLCIATRSFAEVYGSEGRLFAKLAAEASGKADLAEMLRQLESGLADGSLFPPPDPVPLRRLTGFVYPVI